MMLAVEGLQAHYGSAHVLHGVTLEVKAGEIACLIGRNGVGKSTTLKGIMGVVRPTGGTVTFKGERIDGRPRHFLDSLFGLSRVRFFDLAQDDALVSASAMPQDVMPLRETARVAALVQARLNLSS